MRSWGTDSIERKRMGSAVYERGGSTGGLVADEEEAGKVGVFDPTTTVAPSSGAPQLPTTSGSIGGAGSGSRFSDESAAIQARKREAQRSASTRQPPGAFDYDDFSTPEQSLGSEEAETYEMRSAPKPFGSETMTRTDSQESEDTKWGVRRATTAITGGGAGPPPLAGGFEPVRRTDTGFESVAVEGSAPEVKDTRQGVQLVDG